MTPPALASKPELNIGSAAVLRAYDLLDKSRQYADGGPQAIQIAEVHAYLEIAKVADAEDRLLFLDIIKRLDVIYMNHEAEQRKR